MCRALHARQRNRASSRVRRSRDGHPNNSDGGIGSRGKRTSEESEVTFNVSRWYKGGTAYSATLKSSVPVGDVTSADFPAMRKGGRYLVSGDGGFMWACGFTREYSAAEAGQWEAAFGTASSGY